MHYDQYKNRIEIQREYSTGMLKLFMNDGEIHQALLNILDNARTLVRVPDWVYLLFTRSSGSTTEQ